MNPDEVHQKYMGAHPSGNHSAPSAETLRFMQEQIATNKEMGTQLKTIGEAVIRIETQINFY